MLRRKILFTLFGLLVAAGGLFAAAQPHAAAIRARPTAAAPSQPDVYSAKTSLFSLPAGATGGEAQARVVIGLELSMAEGHYAYAHVPTVPRPTDVRVLTADGASLRAEIRYPVAVVRDDFFEPGKRVPAYEGRFMIFVQPLEAANTARLQLSMLVCSQKNCTPVDKEFTVALAGPTLLELPDRMDSATLAAWRAAVPGTTLHIAPPGAPAPSGAVDATSAAIDATSDATAGAAVADAFPPSLQPRFADPGLEPGALFTALWLGLLAGLILNVMPCVLPVLTIKITALLGAPGADAELDATRIRRFREHNLCFAAGIVSWFVLLACAVGGLGLAWGGLFQHVGVVYGLLILVFLLGLSLFDVFTLPVLDFKMGSGQHGSPRLQAYASGLLVTLLATPCSGPLLGGVLGWAASQPLSSVVLVFVATGLGMASPYLALSVWPGVARKLPRPGAWTGIVERVAGFFLMGTALYLLAVLPESLRLPALAVLLVAALAAWLWGRFGSLQTLRRQCLVGALCLGLVAGAVALSLRKSEPAPWQPFTVATFSRDLGKEPMLLEFTADWCPTCKVLEQTVLTPDRLADIRARYGLRLVKVDMTRPDPNAEALLRALGSVSIPVAAIFPTGDAARAPIVLRDVYTGAQLEQALAKGLRP